jgi:8-oxo-dGTP pyrophosphatase MutT (NUDIX family)
MKVIHKIAAVVIEDNKFLLVRKKGASIWTSLGGHPEVNESEEQALMREIKEEMGCDATIERKLGDFEARAGEDDAIIRLSTYLVKLDGKILFQDPELEEYQFIDKDYEEKGFKIPDSLRLKVLPFCIQEQLLKW